MYRSWFLNSSGSGSEMVLTNDMLSNDISLENPSVAFSGDARFMAPLWVSEKADELSQSDPFQSETTSCFELMDGDMDPHDQIVYDKIKAALKLLTFREDHVLVQFWRPRDIGKHKLLTTIDQPYGLGVVNEEFCSYRKDSERIAYVVDKDHDEEEEEDLSPPARVLKKGLAEWSSDVTNYLPKHFPQQESAARCGLHGYLALPVFDTPTRSCVGVLELLTYSKYLSFGYEVQQFEKALKTQDLTCQKISDGPASNVPFEPRKSELDDIFGIMKVVCDTQNIPLAQTWSMSPLNTFSCHKQILTKRCDSLDTKCIGKVCLSTTALPYYVRDLRLWPFWEACRKMHLDKSHSPVGRAMLSGSSCFCGDVTKLSEEEYPLVHFARMSGLSSCFLISLHSVETNNDYVLEFFLPSHIKNTKHLLNLVRMLKENFEAANSRFELGGWPSIEVVGPPTNLGVNTGHDIIVTCSSLMDAFSDEPDIARTSFVGVSDELSSTNVSTAATSSSLKQGGKRKRGSHTMVDVKVTYEDDIKWFWFHISLGLSMLKYEVAKRFGLNGEIIGLKYWDEDDELILICVDDDLEDALISSGIENTMDLICKLSVP